jgi:hypothetical protein
MNKFVLPMTVLFAGLTVHYVKASTITTSAAQPTGNIEISQLLVNGEFPHEQIRKTATSGWRELGQTFTVTTGFTLDKISVKFNQAAAGATAGMSLYVDVFQSDDVSTDFVGPSVIGYPDTGTTGPFTVSTDLWMTFDLPDVALAPGGYGFRIGFDTGDFNTAYQLGFSSLDEGGLKVTRVGDPDYTGGSMFRRLPNTSGTTFPAQDLAFVIQGVPEPSAVMLAGFALLGLIGCGMRRPVR